MKDISAVDELECIVRADPTVLPEVTDRLEAQLASDEPNERMDAGRALRAAANHDPELVLPYEETLVSLLARENGPLRLSGAVGVAELAAVDPERVRHAAPRLVTVLETTVAPAVEVAAIRALTRIGMSDPAAIAAADPIVAERLPTATVQTKAVVLKSFVGAVRADPSLFEETIAAYASCLRTEPEPIARFAAEALAEVATADPLALPSLGPVLERVEELEATVDADPRPGVGDDLKAAARTLREAESA